MWVERIDERPELVLPIAENMREWDKREIYATRYDECPEGVADAVMHTGDLAWTAGLDKPIVAFGCAEMWPNVYSMWLFATDDFGRIGISMTKLIVRTIVPLLFEAGAHRLEARSMEGHDDAQRWLEVIGAKREATLKGYGRERQDFHVYTWERG